MTRQSSPKNRLSRRRLLALATAAASAGTLSGCGYRPGGGDVRWEDGTGTGPYRPDDLLVSQSTVFTVNRSVRGFDFDSKEWGESAEIAAYDAASGGPKWEKKTPPSGRPATSGGRLYVGHENDGLVALESGGGVRWEADVGEFPRTLAAGGERVYALTEAGDLLAFVADDGEQLWQAALGAGERAAILPAPNGVAVHYRDGSAETSATTPTVTVLAEGGNRRWSRELQIDPRGGQPAIDDETGAVYVPSDRVLHALSLDDGSERWSQGVAGIKGSPVVADGRLYHVGGGALYARNPQDGSVLWQFEPDGLRGLSAPPAVADGQVYVAGRDAVYAVAAEDGALDWQVESASVSGAPRVAGETVVVSTSDGYVRGHYRR